MACYRPVADGFDDVAWDNGSVWQLDRSGATGGTPTAPTFALYDLQGNVTDSGGGNTTSVQYSAASSFAADGAGYLYWAEFGSTALVFPTLPHGIAVYRHDIASNVSTQLFTLTAVGGTTDANRKFHGVTGLEWREADGRIYIAWDYNRAAAPEWHIASFLPDGSDYTNHLSGTDAIPQYIGALVFDPDETSLWTRASQGSGFFRVGHIDLSGFSATSDPTSADGGFVGPGFPTAAGLTYSKVTTAEWRNVHFDDPGFTVSASSCPDDINIGSSAYEQSPWGRVAFLAAGQLYVPAAGRRWWAGVGGWSGS